MTDFAYLMQSLDRCEHGRHSIDSCWNCPGGESWGNLLLPAGVHIGHTHSGQRIIVPPTTPRDSGLPDFWNDPKSWIEWSG